MESEIDRNLIKIWMKLGYPNPNAKLDMEFIRISEIFKNKTNNASIDHKTGVIEVDRKTFLPDKGTPEWYKQNINIISVVTMQEIILMRKRITYEKNIKMKEVIEYLTYARDKFNDLRESIRYFLKDSNFDRSKTIYTELALLQFIQMIKKKYKFKIWIYNLFKTI